MSDRQYLLVTLCYAVVSGHAARPSQMKQTGFIFPPSTQLML